jgi:ribosomal protein S24E
MAECTIVNKIENPLLERIEVEALVEGQAHLISRQKAREIIAKEFNVSENLVFPIKIQTSSGKRDAKIVAYIYKRMEDAKRQLPKHIPVRLLPKEEREKVKKEMASKKAAEKQAAIKKGGK